MCPTRQQDNKVYRERLVTFERLELLVTFDLCLHSFLGVNSDQVEKLQQTTTTIWLAQEWSWVRGHGTFGGSSGGVAAAGGRRSSSGIVSILLKALEKDKFWNQGKNVQKKEIEMETTFFLRTIRTEMNIVDC